MKAAWWFALALAGCGGGNPASNTPADAGSDSRTNPTDAGATDSGATDSGATDSGATDSGATDSGATDSGATDSGATDSGAVDAGSTTLPSCLGVARPMVVSSNLPFTDVTVGASTGAFLVDYGTTQSTIDLKAFATPPSATGCDPTKLGQACSFSPFDFFGPWGTVTLITSDHSFIVASVREAGILGTDFLSVNAYTLDYADKRILRAFKAGFCADATLAAAGLAPLSTVGFFSSDPSTLRPLSDVVAGASPGARVPNVPTVPLRVGGATAFAQLDTGFDDAVVPFSINVNAAFYDAIAAKSPAALVRATGKDLSLSTCVSGVRESVEAYTLAGGSAAELLTTGDVAARAYPSAVLFVKRTPAAAKVCGGIGTWTAPAAQLAGSFFKDAGAAVFDPFGSRVWVRRP